MGFMLPPTEWEIQRARPIHQAQVYLVKHGDLPDTPIWRMLERRFDHNPTRFSQWHPNIALMINQSRSWNPPVIIPPLPPISPLPPFPSEPQVVPEPSSILEALVSLAIVGACFLKGWRS